MDIFTYTFFQNAIIGSLLASILCGMVGTYIVTRRLVFISGGLTHASFGGIGLGVYFGVSPILSALLFSVASALGVQWLSHKGHVRQDSTIAFFWTLGMSVGIICCFLSPGFMPDLNSYLFGSILTIGTADLVLLGALTLVVGLLTVVFYHSIVSVAFDPVFARSRRLPVSLIEYTMMALVAMTIVATLRLVGVVLAISLLTIPQMTANVFTYSYKRMIVLSIVIGWIDCMAGLALSYVLNVPSGASIILVAVVVYALARWGRAVATVLLRRMALVWVLAVLALTGCSTQKNTSSARWWHAFKARYNTYYNGSVAYVEGSLEKERGNKDNYTELIPLYPVGNKASRELGKSYYETAVTKAEKAIHQHSIKRRPVWDKQRRKTPRDIEWLSRREYNPFLWKAWMLMGRAQFHMGAFDEAASTFSYMSRLYATQPAIYGKARAWLAKCYAEEGWLYDAEDVIRNMARDSMDWRAVKEWDYAYADYYLHTADYRRAIPYVRRVIRHEMRRKQRAREWFLLGQLYAAVGQPDSAYRAYRRVVRLNPPYELEFNARIAQTEVLAKGQSRRMISRLRRMAASDNNKDYLDQVYYAIGNIYLADRDTLHALSAYETGSRKATRSGIEKGVLLLRLGNLYWQREKFSDARRCYGEAIGLLDQDRPDYRQLSERSQVLDELVPHTEAVALQDSLQALARMSATERNAAIDRVIEALKKKEKEERRAQQESDAQAVQSQNGGEAGMTGNRRPNTQQTTIGQQGNGQWYFYNPMAVSQGKAVFQKLWGKRENVDNWQRINKTVVSAQGGGQNLTPQQADSVAREAARADSLEAQPDSVQNDPHRREYYLAQIPFTPEQVEESDRLIMDGLFHAGVIFKDKLDNLRLSEKYLRRLTDHYPTYTGMDEAYYHLYLLYMRQQQSAQAQRCLDSLKTHYAKSQWTTVLTDPYFVENARVGVHLEDSLYAATYNAFKADRMAEVRTNTAFSARRFPQGANRDKFLFIGALAKLNDGQPDSCLADLQRVVSQFPESDISALAGMIINGVKAGRRLRSDKFDLDGMWAQRAAVLSGAAADSVRAFTPDRMAEFKFVLVYAPDSVKVNQLLFELARYNFTNFMVRNFEISVSDHSGLQHMEVSGFRNYDEALQYARQLYAQHIIQRYPGCRSLVISNTNLELIGHPYSYDDYAAYYAKHFAPLKVSTFRLLTEPDEIVTRPASDPSAEEIDRALDDGMLLTDPEDAGQRTGGTYVAPDEPAATTPAAGTVIPTGQPARIEPSVSEGKTFIPVTTPEGTSASPGATSGKTGTVISTPGATSTPPATTPGKTGVLIPSAEPAATGKSLPAPSTRSSATDKGVTIPNTQPSVTGKKGATPAAKLSATGKSAPAPTAKPATPAAPKPVVSKTGIYFRDKATPAPADTLRGKAKKKSAPAKKKLDLEDEYYDLEGF